MKIVRLIFSLVVMTSFYQIQAQNSVGIGTENPNPNAVLHLVSPTNDQGLLIPTMTAAQRTAFAANLTASETAMMVFDTDDNSFYFWANDVWNPISAQELTAGTGITIDGSLQISNTGDLDATNEIQDLDLTGNTLTITNNGTATSIDLSAYLDNTDDQDLMLSGDEISLSGDPDATVINLGDYVDDADADPTNELQDLNLTSNILTITGLATPTQINLAPFAGTNTDEQELALSTNILSISGGTNTVDLSGYLDNTNLTEGEVDAFVANNGYLTSFTEADPTVPANLKDGVAWSEVSGKPTIPTNTNQLTNGAGFINNAGESDPSVPANLKDGVAWDEVSGKPSIPTSISDLTDDSDFLVLSDLSGWDQNASDDFDGAYGSLSGTPTIPTALGELSDDIGVLTTADVSGWDTDDSDDFDGVFSSLSGIPAGLADGDDFEANTDNQDLSLASGVLSLSGDATPIDLRAWDQNAADDFDGEFGSLANTPAGLADGDDDTQLNEVQVDAFVGNNGYITTESDPTVPANLKDGVSWGEIGGIPASIANGDDTREVSTDFLILTGGDFSDVPDSKTGNYTVVYGDNNASIRLTSVEGAAKLFAPVDLPNGAEINSITVTGASPSSYDVALFSYELGASAINEGRGPEAIPGTTMTVGGSPAKDISVQDLKIGVDKGRFTYFILVFVNNSPLDLYQLKVEYRHSF